MNTKQLLLIIVFLLLPLLMLAQESSTTDTVEVNKKEHFILFMSDVYVGWGGHGIDKSHSGIIKKSHSEAGVLNLLAVGYNFNHERTTLSAGIGFNWTSYSLNKPALWSRGDNGVVGFANLAEPFENHNASLLVRSMQFPIMANQSLGKHWNIAFGPVLNWNYYASMTKSHTVGLDDYSVTMRGLNQRKFSVDGFVRVTWRGMGAYLRYAPMSVFEKGFGPEIKQRWSLGVVVSGLDFGRKK